MSSSANENFLVKRFFRLFSRVINTYLETAPKKYCCHIQHIEVFSDGPGGKTLMLPISRGVNV